MEYRLSETLLIPFAFDGTIARKLIRHLLSRNTTPSYFHLSYNIYIFIFIVLLVTNVIYITLSI